MSVNVPRGTRDERLSLRVPVAFKTQVRDTVTRLQARGLSTSTSEVVEMLVADGLTATDRELDARLRAWRTRPDKAPR